jgi:hypothetical protein
VASTANISVSVAALQLIEVQDVLGAIHNADATTAKRLADQAFAHEYDRGHDQYIGCGQNGQASRQPGQVIQELPTYVPGKVVHLPPRYVHSAPIVDSKPAVAPHLTAAPPPPWKLPLPVEQASLTIVIKKMAERPDVFNKGNLIDLFV